jgi:hypothetical protein
MQEQSAEGDTMLRTLLIASLSLAAGIATAADDPVTNENPPRMPAAELTARNNTQSAASGDPKPEAKAEAKDDTGPKSLSGMSILGNQEAPKALVIVPWKSSQLGDTLGISKTLDDGRQPVDKDVFMRQLSYYEIRSGK